MQTKPRQVTLIVNLEDFEANDGTILHNLSAADLQSVLQQAVSTATDKLRQQAKVKDQRHEFYQFVVEPAKLTKYAETPDIYPHFVHYHLQHYYTNSVDSNHSYNGGHWQHSHYDPIWQYHREMIQAALSGELQTSSVSCSVKNSVLFHFYSGGVIRMYGTPQSYRTIREFQDTADRLQFFDYILDSGMVQVNHQEMITNCDVGDNRHFNQKCATFGEALLHHCIRNKDVEAFQYLVEQKGLDLYAVDAKPYVYMSPRGDIYHHHLSTLLYRLIDDICSSNYEYSFKDAEKKSTVTFFQRLFDYIHAKFPLLRIDATNKNFDKASGVISILNNRWYNGVQSRYSVDEVALLQRTLLGPFTVSA